MKTKRIHILFILLLMIETACKNTLSYKNGTYHGELESGVPNGFGTWENHTGDSIYKGFWQNGLPEGQGTLTSASISYQGEFSHGKYNGFGVLYNKGVKEYVGNWKNGQKEGRGIVYDEKGREINGNWINGKLKFGTRISPKEIYKGEFNQKKEAEGHGTYYNSTGTWYEGHWRNNKRNGFGLGLNPIGQLCAGEWKNNLFKGERLVYTSDRIYGIDISKYQHIHGRKRYPIIWRNLRITHLGHLSKKKIDGEVNYPVSFIYIKSTEGRNIRNIFYRKDYHQAKLHRLKVGNYHFFSIHSSGTQQALFFLKKSYFHKGDLPPVLDIEPSDLQINKMGGIKKLFKEVRTWLRIVEKKVGTKPILYISQSFVNKYLGLAPDIQEKYNIWIARYGEYKPGVHLVYWQLSPDGRVNGIKGEVDINVFNGYTDQFMEFLSKHCIK